MHYGWATPRSAEARIVMRRASERALGAVYLIVLALALPSSLLRICSPSCHCAATRSTEKLLPLKVLRWEVFFIMRVTFPYMDLTDIPLPLQRLRIQLIILQALSPLMNDK